MKRLAIIKYMFIFDPDETWPKGSFFEADLTQFFAAYGYEANRVNTEGGSGERVFHFTKMDKLEDLAKNLPIPRNSTDPQKILKEMGVKKESKEEERFKKGRFLKTKGYLQRKI